MSRFAPLGNRAVLREIVRDRTPAGVILPEGDGESPMLCEVLAVGPGDIGETGELKPPVCVTVRDRVLIGKYAGTVIDRIKGSRVLLVSGYDILCRVVG